MRKMKQNDSCLKMESESISKIMAWRWEQGYSAFDKRRWLRSVGTRESRSSHPTFIMALRATAADPGFSDPAHSSTGSSITTFLLNRIEGAMKE